MQATCPLTRERVVELYFMEHRAKMLDIAAFLDRYDRGSASGSGDEDFRVAALKQAAAILNDGKPERARRILELLSDPSAEPLESAAGLKGAYGAPPSLKPRATGR